MRGLSAQAVRGLEMSAGKHRAAFCVGKCLRLLILFGACLGAAHAQTATNPDPVAFGSQPVGTAQAQTSITFILPGASILSPVNLGTPQVLTQGAPNLDFTPGSGNTCTGIVIVPSCTVTVVFNPKAPGQRFGAVNLVNSSGTTLATALLYGTGTGPAVVYPRNAAVKPLATGFASLYGIAIDGAGNVYVADSNGSAIRKIVAVNGSTSASSAVVTVGGGFSYPKGLAVDGAGNVYVADLGNSAVKEIIAVAGTITSNSLVRTIGSGFAGPYGVAVDAVGNVYVADARNNAVREITAAAGTTSSASSVKTIGSGFNFPTGVAVDGLGNVYVTDYGNNAVKEVVATAGVVSSSSSVQTLGFGFRNPNEVAVDSAGNVYVADGLGTLKEIIAVSGSIPSNPAIYSLYSSNGVTALTLDGAGNVYSTGFGVGAAVEVMLATPPALTLTGTVGNVATQTLGLQNVGNAPLTFAVPSSGTNPQLTGPFTLDTASTCPVTSSNAASGATLAPGICKAVLDYSSSSPTSATGSLVFTDNSNNVAGTTQTIPLTGTIAQATGTTAQTINFAQPQSPAQASTSAQLSSSTTSGLQVIYSVVSGPATISGSTVTYTAGGTVVLQADQYGNNTYAPASVQRTVVVQDTVGVSSGTMTATITSVTTAAIGQIYVLTTGQPNLDFNYASGGTCRAGDVVVAGSTCTVNYTFTPRAPGQRLGAVQLVAADGSTIVGTTLLTGNGTGPAVVFPGNTATKVLGNGFFGPAGVAVDGAANVYVADTNNESVKEIVAAAGATSSTSTVKTLSSGFSVPQGVAVDGAGNVYVADTGNNAVKEIVAVAGATSSTSTVKTLGNGFYFPRSVAVDGSGNVYVADYGNSAVKEIVAVAGATSSTSTVKTLGSGFNNLYGVAVDGAGNVYVADSGNSAVKEIVAVAGVTSSTSTVKTLGSGFKRPEAVAVDSVGNVYVADTFNFAVKEIVAVAGATSSMSTVKTLSSGTIYPSGVAVDGAGNVYVADFPNQIQGIPLAMPPALTFPSTSVGSTSAPQTVQVQNIGNAQLLFPAPASGSNPQIGAYFALDASTTCPQVTAGSGAGMLAAGAFCNEAIVFQPTTAGSFDSALNLTDNSFGMVDGSGTGTAMQTISLTGTATQVAQSITFPQPTSPVLVGSTASLVATASSGLPVVFSVTSGLATLSGPNNAQITYTGAGPVVIAANQAGNAQYSAAAAVSVAIQVQSQPVISWQPSSRTGYKGVALGNSVLNATSSTPGTFAYTATLAGGTPVAITSSSTLTVGTYTLTANFTPTNTSTSAAGSANVAYTVTNQQIFIANGVGSVTSLYDDGSPQTGATNGGAIGAAIGTSGDVWSINSGGMGVSQFTDSGIFTASYTGGGISGGAALAIDGAGVVWIANNTGTLSAIANSGVPISSIPVAAAGNIKTPTAIAVDAAGSLWIANAGNNTATEVIGVATPVTTPTSSQVIQATSGTRP